MSLHKAAGLRIGVLGGTFDPIHVGHLVIAEAARCELGLAQVIFVPANAQPFKLNRQSTAAAHRLAMVRLAVAGNDAFAVSTIELDRDPPSYTADTLRILSDAALGGCEPHELFFICGSDALLDMDNWSRPGEVLQRAVVAVARRPGCGDDLQLNQTAAHMVAKYGGTVRFFSAPRLDVASTEIRDRLARGLSARYLVPDPVLEYAARHGLYGAGINAKL